jgi:hypothetical protein
MQLSYYKWPLIILLTGLLLRATGFLIKILHWPNADLIYPGGLIVMGIGIIALLIKVYRKKNN